MHVTCILGLESIVLKLSMLDVVKLYFRKWYLISMLSVLFN